MSAIAVISVATDSVPRSRLLIVWASTPIRYAVLAAITRPNGASFTRRSEFDPERVQISSYDSTPRLASKTLPFPISLAVGAWRSRHTAA